MDIGYKASQVLGHRSSYIYNAVCSSLSNPQYTLHRFRLPLIKTYPHQSLCPRRQRSHRGSPRSKKSSTKPPLCGSQNWAGGVLPLAPRQLGQPVPTPPLMETGPLGPMVPLGPTVPPPMHLRAAVPMPTAMARSVT